MEGKVIAGKYQLVRLLGVGGMGEVYEARHVVVGRRFALKFLRPELTANTDIVSRFQREAQAAGALENENIAAVVDTGTGDDGAPFLVMEYLEGEDLAHLLVSQGRLSVPRAVYILIQACRGLMAAHAKSIIHRDLKPENLFICKRNDGTDLVKVLDFGIAKLHVGTVMTQTGTTMGTPHYMSLEQARGAKEVDLRTDIYALGVILYEIIGGAKPHPGDNYNEILYHVISKEPTHLDTIRPGLPSGLAAIVHRAMAQEAEDRYASTAEFMTALIPFAERTVTPIKSMVNLPAGLRPTVLTPGSLQGIIAPTSVAAPDQEAVGVDLPTRSFGLGKFGVVLGGVVVLALLVWLVFLRQSSKPQPVVETLIAPVAIPVVVPPAPVVPIITPSPPVPPPAPDPVVAAPANKVETPPVRTPERPSGQRVPKRVSPATTPGMAGKATPRVSPTPPESPDLSGAPRKKLVRSIDRNNPFAD